VGEHETDRRRSHCNLGGHQATKPQQASHEHRGEHRTPGAKLCHVVARLKAGPGGAELAGLGIVPARTTDRVDHPNVAHHHHQATGNPKVPELLGDLASGRIELTHEALHAVASWRTAAYLRDLLMTCGVLPVIDKQLAHYEALLHRRLADLADAGSPTCGCCGSSPSGTSCHGCGPRPRPGP
jgi:hypothetical protein